MRFAAQAKGTYNRPARFESLIVAKIIAI